MVSISYIVVNRKNLRAWNLLVAILRARLMVVFCILIFGSCASLTRSDTLKQVVPTSCSARFAKVGGGYLSLMPKPGYPKLYFIFASWSAESQRLAPQIQSLFERYHSRGLHVVGISLDHQSRVFVETFVEVSGLTFDVLWANGVMDSALTRCLGPTRGVPKIVLIDPKGEVLVAKEGEDAISILDTLQPKITSVL